MLKVLVFVILSFVFTVQAADIVQMSYDDLTKNSLKTEDERACQYKNYNDYQASLKLKTLGEKNLFKIINSGLKVPSYVEAYKLLKNESDLNYSKLNYMPSFEQAQLLAQKQRKNILDEKYFIAKYPNDKAKAHKAYRVYQEIIADKIRSISNKESYSQIHFYAYSRESYREDSQMARESYDSFKYMGTACSRSHDILVFADAIDYNFDESMLDSNKYYMKMYSERQCDFSAEAEVMPEEFFYAMPCRMESKKINQTRGNSKSDLPTKKIRNQTIKNVIPL